MPGTRVIRRDFAINGRATTIRLEPEFWHALEEMRRRERVRSVGEMVRRILEKRGDALLSSAVRIAVIEYFRAAAQAAYCGEDEASAHAAEE